MRISLIVLPVLVACGRAPTLVDTSRPAPAPSARVEVPSPLQSSPSSAVGPSAGVTIGPLACRARDAARIYELFLRWDGNVAHGSLRTTTGAQATTVPVQAELYKGLVLVNPADSPGPEKRIATVQEEGTKTLQVGDWKRPWLACE